MLAALRIKSRRLSWDVIIVINVIVSTVINVIVSIVSTPTATITNDQPSREALVSYLHAN